MENPPSTENPMQQPNNQQQKQPSNHQQQSTLPRDEDQSRTPSPSIIDQLINDRNYSKVLSFSLFMNNDQATGVTVADDNSQFATMPTEISASPLLERQITEVIIFSDQLFDRDEILHKSIHS